jgi:hypothetical protein
MNTEDDDRKILFDGWAASVDAFDKTVTYIASGAFAIAFGFIDKIVKVETACYNWIFLLSLCCFAVPVLGGLYNFLRETHTSEKFIELYTAHSPEQIAYRQQANKVSNRIRVSQMILLITGSLLLLLYITLNTHVF